MDHKSAVDFLGVSEFENALKNDCTFHIHLFTKFTGEVSAIITTKWLMD
ncbi:hypothetical protein SA3033_00570 [Aggregatibacter actinomycetemcomitans serotype d str. SA3033]|nr:hypothetical protein HMPREF9996_01647 [Aggregatibacter actinomycetemcomitans Y4]KYK75858.1 hypothetical protein SA2876_07320 [Aggregatibacter actinomycetemcomitans serotype e str. SA2876]KYK84959.1 hypothetical protein SA3033_00570 [Aggregatibacter actinomycetemcomitans serotype d str. SA3033]KYK86246.1 hypothetical protein SC29R_09905 [Aggregatibacter actinomycetemcomitans serotype f str. SC29R]KYK89735.1 hypothetical protein SA2200_02300 [Aggregatibacter actinomycetemcomitans serotype d st